MNNDSIYKHSYVRYTTHPYGFKFKLTLIKTNNLWWHDNGP